MTRGSEIPDLPTTNFDLILIGIDSHVVTDERGNIMVKGTR